MKYERVIPRDFFNEAKLLKCLGLLSVKILDNMIPAGIKIEITESGKAFDVRQDENDGGLYINNYSVKINGSSVLMKTIYNSKDNYPLLCTYNDYEEVLVFDESGEFSDDFIEKFAKKQQTAPGYGYRDIMISETKFYINRVIESATQQLTIAQNVLCNERPAIDTLTASFRVEEIIDNFQTAIDALQQATKNLSE